MATCNAERNYVFVHHVVTHSNEFGKSRRHTVVVRTCDTVVTNGLYFVFVVREVMRFAGQGALECRSARAFLCKEETFFFEKVNVIRCARLRFVVGQHVILVVKTLHSESVFFVDLAFDRYVFTVFSQRLVYYDIGKIHSSAVLDLREAFIVFILQEVDVRTIRLHTVTRQVNVVVNVKFNTLLTCLVAFVLLQFLETNDCFVQPLSTNTTTEVTNVNHRRFTVVTRATTTCSSTSQCRQRQYHCHCSYKSLFTFSHFVIPLKNF